jgi:uncharacterized protein (UPF0332 family)
VLSTSMVRFADNRRLIRVVKASKEELRGWAEGVSLERDTGHTLDELRHRVTSDRVGLAALFRRRGHFLRTTSPPLNREAVSRFYYSMYHCWRALIYFTHEGDDHQAHSELATKDPPGFPDIDMWKNRVKNARLRRNEADYDAYPKSDNPLRQIAQELDEHSEELLRATRRYLRQRGCRYL